MRKPSPLMIGLLLITLLVASCTATPTVVETEAPADEAAPVEEAAAEAVLEVVGLDESVSLTMADLQSMPAYEGYGGLKSSTGSIFPPVPHKGVPVMQLLDLVGGLEPGYGINVVAKDGYAMTISYEQLVNGEFTTFDPVTGDENEIEDQLQPVLAYEREGVPIPADEDGPLRLVILTPENTQIVDGHWTVKFVNQIVVKDLGLDWSLMMEGAISEEMDRGTFESCTASGCHASAYTDDKAQEWTGVPLWELVGWVDNEEKHGDDSYEDELAQQGYVIELVAADGYTVTFSSADIYGNDAIIVANLVNGNPLDEASFPLQVVGPDLTGKQKIGQLTQINLKLDEAAPAAEEEPAEEAMPAEPAEPVEGAALTIGGGVAEVKAFSLDELQAMEMVELTVEHPKKGEQVYQGVLLSDMLAQVSANEGTTTLVLTASDGYSTEAPLADVLACESCLVTFDEGTLSLVMGGMDSGLWVKDVILFEIK
jgi:DMSO/TMAO reductase YedYZ molybdopterin-dependent catalytic subunit